MLSSKAASPCRDVVTITKFIHVLERRGEQGEYSHFASWIAAEGCGIVRLHDEEFDFTAMCCLCSMLKDQPQALSSNGLEMSSVAVSMVTVQGNVNVIEYIS